MTGCIRGFDWVNVEPMKYWSFPSGTSDEAKKTTVRNAVFSGDYLGSLKTDGYYQRVLKDDLGNIFMIARSRNVKGEIVDKHEWLPHLNPWFDSLPNGSCLLCECYWPGNEGSRNITSILGCLKEKAIARQKDNPLHLYVFDIMAWDGVNYDKEPYGSRAKTLELLAREGEQYHSPYVEWAELYEGQELWSHLQEYLSTGREGMVIMRKDAIVYQKRTPARVSIKIKKELQDTIDCFFTGRTLPPTKEYMGKEIETWKYWENIRTGEKVEGELYNDYVDGASIMPVTKSYFLGFAGSLEIGVLAPQQGGAVYYRDKDGTVRTIDDMVVMPIGYLSGLTEEIKSKPVKYAMKPIEVSAMELYDDGQTITLRHGKFLGFREELALTDCMLAKIRQ